MSTDAIRLPPERAEASAAAGPEATLTHRASLNVIASLVDYTAKVATSLVVVPILVSGLGRSLYGVWEMLGRLVGYMSAGDGRPTQALRLVIANHQAVRDDALKRRYVGGAFVVWLLFLPVIVGAGGLLIWLSPAITKAAPPLQPVVRLTCALLTLTLCLLTLASLPESVLRGMNLGYKRMGLQAGLDIVGGGLTAAAVYVGLGMVGAAGAQVIFAVLTGFCFWWVVKKYVPWFGVARPKRSEVKSLLSLSVWYSAGEAISKLLLASDVVILGIIVSPTAVTSYVLTGYAARLAVNIHFFAAGGAVPGLGGVIGLKQYDKAAVLRTELLAVTWLLVTAVGCTILLWNRSFLSLWVGPANYAGNWINLLLVFIMAQTMFIRSDSYVIDATLQPRLRVIVMGIAAVVTIAVTVALTRGFGMVGLCVGILVGRLTQSVAYPILVHSCLERVHRPAFAAAIRPLAVMSLAFTATAYIGQQVVLRHWVAWAGAVAASLGLTLGLALLAGLPRDIRRLVVERSLEMLRGFRA